MSLIGVYYDHSASQAGSKLSGCVFMEVKEEISATELTAVLDGREKTTILYKETAKDGFIVNKKARSRRPLVELDISLDTSKVIQGGKILPGKYELPFAIVLPDILPSTIAEGNSPGSEFCSLEYGIEVELKGCEQPQDYACHDRAVIMAKPLPKDPVPYMNTLASDLTNTALRRLHMAKVFGKGDQLLLMGVYMQDTVLERGEACHICLSCRNRTDFDVTHVRAEIRETFRWTAEDRVEQRTIAIAMFEFGRFSGLEKLKSNVSVDVDLDDIQKELKTEKAHSFTVTIPKKAHDTFSGTLIKITHEIIVDFETTHDFENPRLEIPIKVGPPSLEHHHGETSKPDEWQSTSKSNCVNVDGGSAILGGSVVHDHAKTRQARRDPRAPSLETLIAEMKEYINDYDLIHSHLQNPEWRPVFEDLSPEEYGMIIKRVDLEFEQSKVAALIAEAIPTFTVHHLVEALKGSSEWNRMGMVDRVIFHCKDLDTNYEFLEVELTRYEQHHCAKYFRIHNAN